MLLRLAWRNLGRNPRRTALTAAAGVFAVVLTLFSLSLGRGSHERWIDQVVRLYPGHVEVSQKGYREQRTLDYAMSLAEFEAAELDALPGLEGWAPRLESWALALPDVDDSMGRAAWLLGIDPVREEAATRLGQTLSAGRFVSPGARELVLGETLAKNLGVEIGDTVVLLAADYYGSQSADRFGVVGLLAVGDPRFDDYAALVPIGALQDFLVAPGGITHVAFFARESEQTEPLRRALEQVFEPASHEILAWPELIPDVVQFMVLDDLGNYLTLAILVVVVAFGLLNTILMSVFERVREFGVMRALGVRPRRVFALVVIESALLSALGIAVGLSIGVPLVLWLQGNPLPMPGGEEGRAMMELFGLEPVLMFRITVMEVAAVTGVLLAVSMIAALPPAVRASRGRPVDALREM
jgi:ABC-type lipoprotein release transport system permease subunit